MSKSNKTNDMVHVAAIRKYLRAAEKFITNVNFDEFTQDEEKQYAVAHAIEQAGENVKNSQHHSAKTLTTLNGEK